MKRRTCLTISVLILLLSCPSLAKEGEWRPSPRGALLRAFLLPGWGQFYNHKYVKGIGVMLIESALIIELVQRWRTANRFWKESLDYPPGSEQRQIYQDRYLSAEARRNAYLWWTSGFVILSALDAYVDAYLYGFKKDFGEGLTLQLDPQCRVKLQWRFK